MIKHGIMRCLATAWVAIIAIGLGMMFYAFARQLEGTLR